MDPLAPLDPDVPQPAHPAKALEPQTNRPDTPPAYAAIQTDAEESAALKQPTETRILMWILLGKHGLRSGWSVVLFLLLYGLLVAGVGFVFFKLHRVDEKFRFTACAGSVAMRTITAIKCCPKRQLFLGGKNG